MTSLLRRFLALLKRIAIAIERRLPLGYQDETGFHPGTRETASEEN